MRRPRRRYLVVELGAGGEHPVSRHWTRRGARRSVRRCERMLARFPLVSTRLQLSYVIRTREDR